MTDTNNLLIGNMQLVLYIKTLHDKLYDLEDMFSRTQSFDSEEIYTIIEKAVNDIFEFSDSAMKKIESQTSRENMPDFLIDHKTDD